MTAPQPSPDHDTDRHAHRAPSENPGDPGASGRHDPWAAPSPLAAAADPPPRGQVAGRIAEGVLVALPVALVTGVALGLLWLWLAPQVPLVAQGNVVLLANSEAEQAIAADGTFLLLGLAVGAAAGLAVFLLRREGGVAVVLGLAAGALGGALLAWGMGDWFGPTDDIVAHAREAGEGVVFDGPLELSAKGVLMGLPFAAIGVHLLCVAIWGPREEQKPPAEYPNWRADG
ncbi:ABC transporter permease [Streptomyces sp. 6N223]|uniref:ABC transporter permease n=1 Tax=Streptomyces sp. 6N223 TaxID=3457412 RepID=UPI003FD1D78D